MDMDFVKNLGDAIQEETAPGVKMKTINKEDYRENLMIQQERLNTLIITINTFVGNEKSVLADRIFKASADRKNIACNIYVAIARAIGRNDLKIAFESIRVVCDNYIKIITVLNRSVATTFKDVKGITIYNTKLSHVANFGIVREIEMFTDYTNSLINGITYELCKTNGVNELSMPKQYRIAYITNSQAEYTELLKTRLQFNNTAILQELDKISKNGDINIVGNDNAANLGFVQTNNYSPMMKGLISTGSRKFFLFRWLGELWNLIKHNRYLKAKKEKEWLEAHVALLKLQMQGVDPNSEEYRKQVQIIESYNEMIAELDQKIDSYMNN